MNRRLFSLKNTMQSTNYIFSVVCCCTCTLVSRFLASLFSTCMSVHDDSTILRNAVSVSSIVLSYSDLRVDFLSSDSVNLVLQET